MQGERQQGLDFVDNVFCKAQIKGNLWRFIYLFFFNVAKLHRREVQEKELRWMRNVGAISRGKKTIDGIWVKVRENRAWNQEREKWFSLGT